MPEIKLLDQATINQIAAGEVIDRPSSVVKELLENAMDAKATAITVEIKDGGVSFIRVTDNGCGIDKGQIPLAFCRHATSKLHTIEDLLSIGSLGFRGEALSSIAAVAQVELITKTPTSILGVSYRIEGGEEIGLTEIGAPEGTTILVRNLFYHVPARKKFLKTAATEGNYIGQLMENMAMLRPDISIRFINSGQTKLYTSGNGRMRDLIYTIYGREISSNLLEVSCKTALFTVTGYLGKPIISRGNRSFENYYINGRFVKSRLIAMAIEQAYKPFMMQHRYPFTVLHIQIDPELIDVNVHPSKMEIRFQKEQEILEQLTAALESTLRGKEFIPDITEDADSRKNADKETKTTGRLPEPFEKRRLEAIKEILPPPPAAGQSRPQQTAPPKQTAIDQQTAPVRQPVSVQGPAPIQQPVSTQEPAPVQQPVSAQEHASAQQPVSSVRTDTISQSEGHQSSGLHRRIGQENTAAITPGLLAEPEHNYRVKEPDPVQLRLPIEPSSEASGSSESAPAFSDESGHTALLLSKEARKHHRLIGQLFDTYWLIQYDNSLYIMDQHAAHEKVNYERLMASYQNKERLSQFVSPPMILSLTHAEESILELYRPVFEKMGFSIEPYGGREYAITEVPANLYSINEKDLFLEVLSDLAGKGNADASELVAAKLASMSCKAAIKGGQHISFAEADALLDQLLTLENPYACPHGRPTIITMTKTELEKKFKRIV